MAKRAAVAKNVLWRAPGSLANLCADIFPISTSQIFVLQRSREAGAHASLQSLQERQGLLRSEQHNSVAQRHSPSIAAASVAASPGFQPRWSHRTFVGNLAFLQAHAQEQHRFGYIVCPETQQLFGKNVLVSGRELAAAGACGGLKIGSRVSFRVKEGQNGPKATDFQKFTEDAAVSLDEAVGVWGAPNPVVSQAAMPLVTRLEKPGIIVAEGSASFGASEDLGPWLCEGWEGVGLPPQSVLTGLAAAALQRQSDLCEASRKRRTTRWAGYDVELRTVFSFRARALDERPCVDALVRHLAQPPPELVLSQVCSGDGERAVGLDVRVLPSGGRGKVVGFAGRLGEGSLRDEMMGLTTSGDMLEAIRSASSREPCWFVRLRNSPIRFTYLGTKLQPALTWANMQQLQQFMGTSRADSTAMRNDSIMKPRDRQQLIDEELERLGQCAPSLTDRLFPSKPWRVRHSAEPVATHVTPSSSSNFGFFAMPGFAVGGGEVVKQQGGSAVWAALEKHGLYAHQPQLGKDVRLRGYVLGKTKPSRMELVRAGKCFDGVASMLGRVGLAVDTEPVVAMTSVTAALKAAAKAGAQAAVFFASVGSGDWYHALKGGCLACPAPGLSHLASQWVDLSRPDHQRPAQLNMALQLCAKLGHTPYVLDTGVSVEAAPGPVFCGVDVCHLQDPAGGAATHLTAGIQLRGKNGEMQDSWLCQGKIRGENIPPWIWETVVSREACEGRQVVVHRDGRFTTEEREFLMRHAEAVGAAGPFGLVEIVKYAGGTPRFYAGTGNAPSGSFLRLSETEALLASGDVRACGTRNPLLVRVVGSGTHGRPALSVEEAAEDIFRLSLISYASIYSSPRLPVTTRTADKAAYLHASMGNRGQEVAKANKEQVGLVSHGRQQYWL